MYRRRCPVIILNIAACFHSFLRNDPDELIFAKDIFVLLFHSTQSMDFNSDLARKCHLFQPFPLDGSLEVLFTCRVAQTLLLTLSHTHKANQFLCSSCWVCILFPELLISCLASSPALPSSLCPHCPEQSGGQLTLPLDWRLCLLHINRCRSIYLALMKILLQGTKAFLFLPAPSVALHGLEMFKL